MCPGDETVGAYVAGQLAGADRFAFDEHLDTCKSCQELVASLARANAPTDDARGDGATTDVRARKTLGRYVIDGVLGAGGMGVVYRANDPELGRPVALKVVRPHDGTDETHARARLVREARAMAKITHPNVIVVHDAGTVGDEVFIAMELVDGQNLAEWEKAKSHPWREVIDLYLQAGRGLAAAHRAGLVHRDFKPHNTLVSTDLRVRVLDFGLARSVDEQARFDPAAPTMPPPSSTSNETTLTRTGAVMGSPQFMSPEQHRGERADARSDQFSFCVALYHALYGRYPYAGATYEQLSAAVTKGEAEPAPRATKVPSAIGNALARGLRRDPDERFPEMDDLVIALTSATRGRRPFWIAAAVLATVGALGVAVAVLATRSHPTATAPIAMSFSKHQQPVTSTGAFVGMPDLSPDGRHLLYSTVAGVAFRDLTTGATNIVSELGEVSGIRWSPTGDRVVVSTEQGPVVLSATGGDKQLFPLFFSTCTAAWSPDATQILWGCDGPAGFTLLTLATGTSHKLEIALPATESLNDFDWSSTGIVIATQPDGKPGASVLWLAHSDGTHLTRLADDSVIGCVRWNARGDRVYHNRVANPGFEIVYRDVKAPAQPPVTVLVQPLAEFSLHGAFTVAHDERSVVYVQMRTFNDVMLYTPNSPVPREVTADRLPKQALSVSPDSKSIVFASGSLEQMSLYHQRLDGGAPQRLPAPERFYIQSAVSPDGQQVVATSLSKDVFHTSVVPVGGGAARDLTHPPTNLFWPPAWTPQNQIVLLAASRSNYVTIDPTSGTAAQLWPADVEQPLFNTSFAPDGLHIAANVPIPPDTSAFAIMSIADHALRILTPVSAATPIGWSKDGQWIYAIEDSSDDPKRRVIAISAKGDGTSRLIAVTGPGSSPVVLPDESGVVQVAKTRVIDLWFASLDARPAFPPGPPAPPPPPVTPPAFHPTPQNLALTGTPGTPPSDWVRGGSPNAPTVTSACGRPGTCVELDGASEASISQYIDATPYRGKRIKIEFDARVEKTTLFVGANSGVIARTEKPAGRVRVTDQAWERRSVTADVAPDAIYIKIKAMVNSGDGRAWIANLAVSL